MLRVPTKADFIATKIDHEPTDRIIKRLKRRIPGHMVVGLDKAQGPDETVEVLWLKGKIVSARRRLRPPTDEL